VNERRQKMSEPDFSEHYPKKDKTLKIIDDTDNKAHEPHFDIIQSIEGGTEKIRITPDGDIIESRTNLKGVEKKDRDKFDWP